MAVPQEFNIRFRSNFSSHWVINVVHNRVKEIIFRKFDIFGSARIEGVGNLVFAIIKLEVL